MATAIDPTQPFLLTSSTPQAEAILNGIAYIHSHCILYDHTLATYLPPLSHAKMLRFWQVDLEQVTQGRRRIIVQLMPITSRTANTPRVLYAADVQEAEAPEVLINEETYEVAGVVCLSKPEAETGPFRGVVLKLFTSPDHRRKGVARSVMRELERVAVADGRWSLMLDTTVGSEAENVYPKLGYNRVGYVKDYGINPLDGTLVDEVWFSKDLRSSPPL